VTIDTFTLADRTRGPVAVRCGRVITHPSGIGYRVMLPDGSFAEHDDGTGLTVSEAEETLDRIENFLRERVK
jgi:hypothetical protein